MKQRPIRETADKRRPYRETGEIQTLWTLVVAVGFALLLLLQNAPTKSAATTIEPAAERVPSHAMTESR